MMDPTMNNLEATESQKSHEAIQLPCFWSVFRGKNSDRSHGESSLARHVGDITCILMNPFDENHFEASPSSGEERRE